MNQQLDDLLGRWGAWHALHWDFKGYPSRSIFASLTDPHYFRPGHKILCVDPPAWIWPVDRAVARIHKPNREALVMRYCHPPVDGKLLSERQIARLMGISRSAYRQRLYKARAEMTRAFEGWLNRAL